MYVWMYVRMYVCLYAWMDVYVCPCVSVFPFPFTLCGRLRPQSGVNNKQLHVQSNRTSWAGQQILILVSTLGLSNSSISSQGPRKSPWLRHGLPDLLVMPAKQEKDVKQKQHSLMTCKFTGRDAILPPTLQCAI